MKVRESGMPEEAYWETLFDVGLILDRLGVNFRLQDVVEFGCGYGTFTIPIAKRISGTVTTFDIDPDMIERTRNRAESAASRNISYALRDVFAEGFGIEPASQDACLLFNILHCEEPVRLLAEAARIVRPGGAVLAIHWRCDPATPRGPSMGIRPTPEKIVQWAAQTNSLKTASSALDLPPWHYGLRFSRNGG
jgi:SAM-dependent methyltransferase